MFERIGVTRKALADPAEFIVYVIHNGIILPQVLLYRQAARCQYPFHCRDTAEAIAAPATSIACEPLSTRRLSSLQAASPA